MCLSDIGRSILRSCLSFIKKILERILAFFISAKFCANQISFPLKILERIDAPNFQRPERPDHCPMEIYKIMTRHCWNHNPEERASFEALEKMILKVFQLISFLIAKYLYFAASSIQRLLIVNV